MQSYRLNKLTIGPIKVNIRRVQALEKNCFIEDGARKKFFTS